MAYERDGHIRNVDNMKGHASKVAKRIRQGYMLETNSGLPDPNKLMRLGRKVSGMNFPARKVNV